MAQKAFLLKNLLKLKNIYGEVDEEALDNLLEAFRDELYHLWQSDPHPGLEDGSPRREAEFDARAKERILSINN